MASRPPPSSKPLPSGAPNQTLYISNLSDKISTEDLRRELYLLFSSYGPILDIVTHRRSKSGKNMRGQAHVCFRDVQTSTQAMRGVNNQEFLGREVRVQYGRGVSGIISKLSGSFVENVATGDGNVGSGQGTELQRSVFGAPSGSLPGKPVNGEPHGVKRPREEAEDEDREDDNQSVEMEEDDEDDAPMEEDDDD